LIVLLRLQHDMLGSPLGLPQSSNEPFSGSSGERRLASARPGVQPRLKPSAKATLDLYGIVLRPVRLGRPRHESFSTVRRGRSLQPLDILRLSAEGGGPVNAARFLRCARCSCAPFGCQGSL
jgi:hypothetical protein